VPVTGLQGPLQGSEVGQLKYSEVTVAERMTRKFACL
jgi:hypothetical protein